MLPDYFFGYKKNPNTNQNTKQNQNQAVTQLHTYICHTIYTPSLG